MSQPIIEVRGVYKSFPLSYAIATFVRHLGRPPRREALTDITLDVQRGELLALLGPNGAGKTTLLKLLATLSIPDVGSIRIAGIDAAVHQLDVRAIIGLCPSEERSFYYRLTARQNLEFFGALSGLRGAALRRRIVETTQAVNLEGALDRRYDSFSSGQRQRLALARALLADPAILLLDEPTRAVDPLQALAIRKLVKEDLVGRQGKTVILATNLLEEAWQLADRVAVISDGMITAIGPPNSLLGSGARLAVYEVVFDRPGPDVDEQLRQISAFAPCEVTAINGTVTARIEVEASAQALTELLRMVSAAGAVREFRPVEPEPAHVFRQVIARAQKAAP